MYQDLRGLDVDGNWHYGDITGNEPGLKLDTVGRFTGIRSKHGDKVYAEDIVCINKPEECYVVQGNGYLDVDVEKGYVLMGVVRYMHDTWFIDTGDGTGLPLDFEGEGCIEIHGNVHQHMHLLTKHTKGGYLHGERTSGIC